MKKRNFTACARIAIAFAMLMTGSGSAFAQADTEALVKEGEILFQETAGDVGCAMCHGADANGDPAAGGPNLHGVSRAQIDAALDGAVPVMEFLGLSDPQREAVYLYLESLSK